MRRYARWLTMFTCVAACSNESVATDSEFSRIAPSLALTPGERKDLATLRRVTAPFQRFDNAAPEGWSLQITDCMTSPAGGMGVHYGKPAFIDGQVRVDQPEVLLYEPDALGGQALVGVEYIVPLSAWTSPVPPRLFGRDFHVIAAFQVWALHVWLWKENPSGLFTDWNPRVTCDHATAVSSMSHH